MGIGGGFHSGFGFGPAAGSMAGFPNFRQCIFQAEFPSAILKLNDPSFPGEVQLTGFNPFIPGEADDSSLPAAFFEIQISNSTQACIDYSVALSVANPSENSLNFLRARKGATLIHLMDRAHSPEHPRYGDLTIGTDASDVDSQVYWYRGGWNDNLEIFWRDFASSDPLPSRRYRKPGIRDHATLMATLRTMPKSRGHLRFILSWNYPNCLNYWGPKATNAPPKAQWKNYYAKRFSTSVHSALFGLRHWERLKHASDLFQSSLHETTLPIEVLEAISNNLSVLKSPTVLRLSNGEFYGWEGCHTTEGSCEGTCTHVWNYAYALPFLFPQLERSIRDLNWKYNQRDDGGLVFRLQLPLGSKPVKFRPCCDGQFGDVIKFYRDWKISGDTEWMRSHWPSAKRAIEFAWAPTNEDRWDPGKTGVLHGRQHHTLDMELFGPNPWLTGFYLAALKAGSEMAEAAGDFKAAKEFRKIFACGQAWVARHLFNGSWFVQKLSLSNRSILKSFDAVDSYWNQEHNEIKYQLGEGVSIDQVVAQWHSNICGLGEIFRRSHTRKALNAIYQHNFVTEARSIANPWRLYSLYEEGGVRVCTWPKGARKPVIPVPYNSETMYGFEYSAAALMIQEGLVDEGLEIIRTGRKRFDGHRRNPWNEFECGSNYARSMASYSLLLALSGFKFDATRKMIGFSPQIDTLPFRSFWSLGTSWGTVEFRPRRISLKVLYGCLALDEFQSDQLHDIAKATLAGKPLRFIQNTSSLHFHDTVHMAAGAVLILQQG